MHALQTRCYRLLVVEVDNENVHSGGQVDGGQCLGCWIPVPAKTDGMALVGQTSHISTSAPPPRPVFPAADSPWTAKDTCGNRLSLGGLFNPRLHKVPLPTQHGHLHQKGVRHAVRQGSMPACANGLPTASAHDCITSCPYKPPAQHQQGCRRTSRALQGGLACCASANALNSASVGGWPDTAFGSWGALGSPCVAGKRWEGHHLATSPQKAQAKLAGRPGRTGLVA